MSGFLAIDHFPRVSRQSRLSADKSDNEMIPRSVAGSPSIYVTAEENTGKPQVGDRPINAVRPIITSNEDPYLQMWLSQSQSISGMEMEGMKERKVETTFKLKWLQMKSIFQFLLISISLPDTLCDCNDLIWR